jgi:hypothetical protein
LRNKETAAIEDSGRASAGRRLQSKADHDIPGWRLAGGDVATSSPFISPLAYRKGRLSQSDKGVVRHEVRQSSKRMSHSMWLARTSRIVGNRRWQAGRQRENLRSAQLPCHHAPTFLVISPQTHTSPNLWEMQSESFPVDCIEECILRFVL